MAVIPGKVKRALRGLDSVVDVWDAAGRAEGAEGGDENREPRGERMGAGEREGERARMGAEGKSGEGE